MSSCDSLSFLFGNRLQYGHCRYQAFEYVHEFRTDTYVWCRCPIAYTHQLEIFAHFLYLFAEIVFIKIIVDYCNNQYKCINHAKYVTSLQREATLDSTKRELCLNVCDYIFPRA